MQRQLAQIYKALGLRDQDIERMEYEAAMDYAVDTGDPALIKQHLIKINQRPSLTR